MSQFSRSIQPHGDFSPFTLLRAALTALCCCMRYLMRATFPLSTSFSSNCSRDMMATSCWWLFREVAVVLTTPPSPVMVVFVCTMSFMSLSQVNSDENRPLKEPGSLPFSLLAYIFFRISLMASITAFLFIVTPFSFTLSATRGSVRGRGRDGGQRGWEWVYEQQGSSLDSRCVPPAGRALLEGEGGL